MARIVGGIGTSHIPSIGSAIAQGKYDDPYWAPLFDGYPPIHRWLDDVQPDAFVVVYNDHGLNFFLNNMPTFAIGTAESYDAADEGFGVPSLPTYRGHAELSWHLVESVIDAGFDPAICQSMHVDHALTVPMSLLFPPPTVPPVRIVPVALNGIQHPLPRPDRVAAFGRALGEAIASFPGDERVVVLGTGGLSHQLDGTRAGFINKEFDLRCLDALVHEPEWIANQTNLDLIEQGGSQGAEIVMWLAMRSALPENAVERHRNYHIPISNTAAACLLLESVG